jgi:hypothetical protein
MANRHVVISVGDEVRLDCGIPETHFGQGMFVTNRIMGTLPFTVGARVVIGDAEIGQIVAIHPSALDDRWDIHYEMVAEMAEQVPAQAEAVPATRRRRRKKIASPPATTEIGPVEAEAAIAQASVTLREIETGVPDAVGD